jgi:hypothetical protein
MKAALPAKLGAQPKQVAWLAGLLVVALVVYLFNRSPSAPDVPTSARPAALPGLPSASGPRTTSSGPMPAQRVARGAVARSAEDFRPTLKLKEGTDVSRIDPTLKLDLLAKVHNVPMDAGTRSIFELSAPPAPPPPAVKPIKPGAAIAAAQPPKPVDPGPVKPPAPPPPPPIPLKFYGYANTQKGGPKRAFFIDGEDIFTPTEGELVKNRYKIIRIGLNSAVVEDTTNKNQQTLPLEAELAG